VCSAAAVLRRATLRNAQYGFSGIPGGRSRARIPRDAAAFLERHHDSASPHGALSSVQLE
jgi:hypothetical protein